MTVFNLGSINADHFYRVPHLPAPGETLAAAGYRTGLGGKGANQSVAAALAGSSVVHIGAVGPDGRWAAKRLAGYGIDVTHVDEVETPTAHAIINVDDAGENAIVIYGGANEKQSLTRIKTALSSALEGDILLLQNETDLQVAAAQQARACGMYVIYSAAPFSSDAVQSVLPYTDLLVVNEIEAGQLTGRLGVGLSDLPVPNLLITRGAEGSTWLDMASGNSTKTAAFTVDPVDTTGAGDCFIGYTAAMLDQGRRVADAMRLGAAAAALKVTRHGTAEAIPTLEEVELFLAEREAK